LPENVEIGPQSWVYSSFAFLHYRSRRPCGVRIGHDSGIYHGTFFDLDTSAEVVVGNYCTIVGAPICVRGTLSIAVYVVIDDEVTIADDVVAVPPDIAWRSATGEGPLAISIGEGAWIGARAVILAGARIGAWAVVGAGSVVTGDVPPRCVVAGNPARRVK